MHGHVHGKKLPCMAKGFLGIFTIHGLPYGVFMVLYGNPADFWFRKSGFDFTIGSDEIFSTFKNDLPYGLPHGVLRIKKRQ
jgi:hypothetical protein